MKTRNVARLTSNKGFTLVELMVAAGSMAFVLFGISTSVRLLHTAYKDIAAQQAEVLSSAILGASFTQVAEASTPSAAYMHIPISKTCGDAKSPCIRQMVKGQFLTPAAADMAGIPNSIQFFRDDTGTINSTLPVLKGAANVAEAKYAFSESMPTVKNLANKQLFATWPLWDQTSVPLVSLVKSSGALFAVPAFTALAEVPSASANQFFLKTISGSLTPAAANDLKGKLLVLSNTDNNKFFTLVQITSVYRCTAVMSDPCHSVNIMPPSSAGNVKDGDLLVTFGPAPADSLLADIGGASAYPAATWQSGLGSSSSAFFPSKSINIADSGVSYLSPGNFHPRKLLHYFHSQSITGGVVATPVSVVTYGLESSGTGKYNLVRTMHEFGQPIPKISKSIAGDLTAPVILARQLGTLELGFYSTKPIVPGDTTVDLAKYSFSNSIRGYMKALPMTALSRDPNPIQYPRTCEMTFSFISYCGDGDVDHYYHAGNGKTNGELFADGDDKFNLVLGYWVEVGGGDKVPTPEEWYAIGWGERDLSSSSVGLTMINSNVVRSGNDLLKEEMDLLAGLARYAPADYEVFTNAMVCKEFQTADEAAVPITGTLPSETDDSISTDVAGYAVSERAWKTGVIPVTAHDTYTAGAVAGACELPTAPVVPPGPGGFGGTPGGTLPYVYEEPPPTSLGPGCTATPVETYGTVSGVYGIIKTYSVTCPTVTTPPPPTGTDPSCANVLPSYVPKCGGSVSCTDGQYGYTGCDPYFGCYDIPSTPATIIEQCGDGSSYVNGVAQAPPGCVAQSIGTCDLPATAHGASNGGSCNGGYTGSCGGSCSAGTWSVTTNSCVAPPGPNCGDDMATAPIKCGGTRTCQYYYASISYGPYGEEYPIPAHTIVQEVCSTGKWWQTYRYEGSAQSAPAGAYNAPAPTL